jgi:hypothetical protein
MYPDHIHLCIVEEDWENNAGEQRRGQSTWFMRNNYPGLEWGQNQGQHADAPVTPWTSGIDEWQQETASSGAMSGNVDNAPATIDPSEACHIPVRRFQARQN